MTGPQSDPRYDVLIRKNPYSLHSQLCPVAKSTNRQPNVDGTTSDCNCWRRGDVQRLLAEIDAADEAAGIRRVSRTEDVS